jgi:hypothetical protein
MIEMKMAGGLGNQLFQYFAGWSLANNRSTGLILDYTHWDLHNVFHGETIENFNLIADFRISKPSNVFTKILVRVDRRLLRKNHLYRHVSSAFSKRWFAPTIGFEANLNSLASQSKIHGYFQTWRYFEDFKRKNLDFQLALKKMSSQCIKLSEEVDSTKPVMVHVRRGDYKKLSNSFGILSGEYYFQSVKQVRKKLPRNPIWLFSDEPEIAIKMFNLIEVEVEKVISGQELQDSTESLYLMSRCAGHIVANSTFSWWGAAFSKSSEIVIAPDLWFKGMEEPVDLIPKTWVRIESRWENS